MVADPSLEIAIQALRRGDRDAARESLLQITADQPLFSEGWLWLAAASTATDEKRAYLRQAFALAPHDRRVVAGLRVLGDTVAEPGRPAITPTPSNAQAASADMNARPALALSPSASDAQAASADMNARSALALSPSDSDATVADATVQPASPLAAPRFVTTGEQAPRVIPWRLIALVCVLMLLIPLSLWLI